MTMNLCNNYNNNNNIINLLFYCIVQVIVYVKIVKIALNTSSDFSQLLSQLLF